MKAGRPARFSHACHFGPILWLFMILPNTYSKELTVKKEDLRKCVHNDYVCVIDQMDCAPTSPGFNPGAINMSCFYHPLERSVTCFWNHSLNIYADTTHTLIFSKSKPIKSCQGIINPSATLNVTLRIWTSMNAESTWSSPHTMEIYRSVKAPQPVVTLVNTSMDSLWVTWAPNTLWHSICQVRHNVCSNKTWPKITGYISVKDTKKVVYPIKGLNLFTSYCVAVSCLGDSGYWSQWSSEVIGTTLERVPSRPPEVCYRVKNIGNRGMHQLLLMWEPLPTPDAGGRILGYEVSYTPMDKHLQASQAVTTNTTDLTALLIMEEVEFMVSVRAYNSAGQGPASILRIDPKLNHTLNPVRGLWVTPGAGGLLVHWFVGHIPNVPPQSPSRLAINWAAEVNETDSHWTRVDGFSTSTLWLKALEADQNYRITVYPIYGNLCGPPQSVPANLEYGVLLDPVRLQFIDVSKTTATIEWVWQRKDKCTRVLQNRLVLRQDTEEQALLIWPDMRQHTFLNLRANIDYSVHILADNSSREILSWKKHFDDTEIAATVTPVILFALVLGVACSIFRTVCCRYKTYFFPNISSPGASHIGQWLLDPFHKKSKMEGILKLEDFLVTDLCDGDISIEVKSKTTIFRKEHCTDYETLVPLNPEDITGTMVQRTKDSISFSILHRNADSIVNCDCPEKTLVQNNIERLALMPYNTDCIMNSDFQEQFIVLETKNSKQMECVVDYIKP